MQAETSAIVKKTWQSPFIVHDCAAGRDTPLQLPLPVQVVVARRDMLWVNSCGQPGRAYRITVEIRLYRVFVGAMQWKTRDSRDALMLFQ